MKLSIQNFAEIKKEEIELNGLTLVAGLNDTGKSTIGKIIHAIFKSLNNIEEKIKKERERSILAVLRRTPDLPFIFSEISHINRLATSLNELTEPNKENIINTINSYSLKEINDNIIDIEKIIEIKNIEEEEIKKKIITRTFRKIFCNQINSIFNDELAEITLDIQGKNSKIQFKDNECILYESETNIFSSSYYINNPFVMDKIDTLFLEEDDLLKEIYHNEESIVDSILGTSKLESVFQLFDSVAPYEIVNYNRQYYAKRKSTNDLIKISNLSTGIKSFLMIRKLIENGSMKEKDVLILDEPEIHLHPEWQIVYAELIILIQKVLNLTIFITSHSPYFIESMEIFAKKYEILDKTIFYLASKRKEEITMKKVKNTESIFELLAKPFQQLEMIEENLLHKIDE